MPCLSLTTSAWHYNRMTQGDFPPFLIQRRWVMKEKNMWKELLNRAGWLLIFLLATILY